MPQYVFVTGGVVSSLGKGLTAASIAKLLEARGLCVAMLKLDPYLNVDPGTMNPAEHGEVYVTEDGKETDLDLGHYYRFTTGCPITKDSSVTAGEIYETVIRQERRGAYLGRTVQTFPHITDEIKRRIRGVSCADTDIVIVEIGGTVGDTEQEPFLKAIQQFRHEAPRDSCVNIHLALIVYLKATRELKSKPTQHSLKLLNSAGITPDILVCRTETPLGGEHARIARLCGMPESRVFEEVDIVGSIYNLPLILNNIGLDAALLALLGRPLTKPNLDNWYNLMARAAIPLIACRRPTVGVVGKYTQNPEAYKSLLEALFHASVHVGATARVELIDAESADLADRLAACAGVVVPGGFGVRGWDGKLAAARYCREQKRPYLGICLGMQAMCVEYARTVRGLADADSTEMNAATGHPVVQLLAGQTEVKGGTMRLGSYDCVLAPGTKLAAAYRTLQCSEIHRHRYELVADEVAELGRGGGAAALLVAGRHGALCEAVELAGHPFMVGVQYHPEFKSKLERPHPLFEAFVLAMLAEGA